MDDTPSPPFSPDCAESLRRKDEKHHILGAYSYMGESWASFSHLPLWIQGMKCYLDTYAHVRRQKICVS